jgi:hypothetical protein
MDIIRAVSDLLFQPALDHPVSAPTPQTVQVFIEGHACEFKVGSHENRQQIKAMFAQLPQGVMQEGQPYFSAATGEQKAAVKALNTQWFLT